MQGVHYTPPLRSINIEVQAFKLRHCAREFTSCNPRNKGIVAFSMNLIAVCIALIFVCKAEATTPLCHICASPHAAPAPAIRQSRSMTKQAMDNRSADPPAPVPVPSADHGIGPAAPEGVFDVTKYGAVADGKTDSSSALSAAWEAACDYDGDSTLFIPNGTFFVGPITFSGPCNNDQSPKVEIRGTLKAPSSLKAFPTPTWIMFRSLNGLRLTGGTGTATLDAQGVEAWNHESCRGEIKCDNLPRSMRFINVSSGTISDIALLNSKSFHISFLGSKNINIHGLNITAPWDSPNTDGIHVSDSININITSSTIAVGDDCVSIGPGSINTSVFNVTCGPGHGISIGSLGEDPNEKDVIGVSVRNCTIKDTQNGARIKTWPGSPASKASNMTFEDIVMINVSNPIIIDQEYCPEHTCGDLEPSLVKLSNISFRNIRGTSNTKPAVTIRCSSTTPCENMELVNVNLNYTAEVDEDNPRTAMSVVKKFVVKVADEWLIS